MGRAPICGTMAACAMNRPIVATEPIAPAGIPVSTPAASLNRLPGCRRCPAKAPSPIPPRIRFDYPLRPPRLIDATDTSPSRRFAPKGRKVRTKLQEALKAFAKASPTINPLLTIEVQGACRPSVYGLLQEP